MLGNEISVKYWSQCQIWSLIELPNQPNENVDKKDTLIKINNH